MRGRTGFRWSASSSVPTIPMVSVAVPVMRPIIPWPRIHQRLGKHRRGIRDGISVEHHAQQSAYKTTG